MEEPAGPKTRIRALFARREDPYAGADIALARRFAVGLWTFATLAVLTLEAIYPPTRELGAVGWVFAGVALGIAVAIVWVLADKRREIGFDFLFSTQFVGLVLIAATQFCAGGREAPYHELFLLQLVGAALMHPPRRVFMFLLGVVGALFVPLAYAAGSVQLGEVATELIMWSSLAAVLMTLMRKIRSQRVQLQRESALASRLARVDSLTGLGNRRAFDEALDTELARSRRSGAPLSLLVADLNGFKEINDRFGHQHGDLCLRQAAIAIRATVRRADLCFRWGGDEFAVLLADAEAHGAEALAIRVEKTVARLCSKPGGGSLTVTCGQASLDAEMTAGDALARADEALRQLKSHGRAPTRAFA